MPATLAALATPAKTCVRQPSRVSTCYSTFDAFFPAFGFFDLTEGIYGNRDISFEQAQINQRDYLLDQVRCGNNSRILDIGCGYGTLLRQAADRGADGTGI